MSPCWRIAASFLAFVIPALAQADKPLASLDRTTALRGQSLNITLSSTAALSGAGVQVFVDLNQFRIKTSSTDTVTVPFDLKRENGQAIPLGMYDVTLVAGAKSLAAGKLNVVASPVDQPARIEIVPAVIELTANPAQSKPAPAGRAHFSIRGRGFDLESPPELVLLVNRAEQSVVWLDRKRIASLGDTPGACSAEAITLALKGVTPGGAFEPTKTYGLIKSAEEVEICNLPVAGQGKLELAVRQGASESTAVVVPATKWSRSDILRLTSLAAAALIGLVYLLVSFKGAHIIRKRSYRFRALLLDKETNTYSLSIVQFLLWTVTAAFAYIYLAASKLFVQGLEGIPDVPDVLPGIVGVGLSAGTAVVAQVVGQVRSKGGGEELPSPSDLVTSGGAVAPDRIQMLVWTLISVGFYFAEVLKRDPATIATLPEVPNTLMALMGLSSVGYLGAKFARKPGPMISELSVTPSTAAPAPPAKSAQGAEQAKPAESAEQPAAPELRVIEIRGQNLSAEAVFSFRIGEEVCDFPTSLLQAKDGKRAPEVLQSDESNPAYARRLRLTIAPAELDASGRATYDKVFGKPNSEISLCLANPDGLKTVKTFSLEQA